MAWPIGDGEMAVRVRSHDWAITPLGPLADWPQHLKTTVELVLAHGFPMCLLWGPEHIQIYNDPHRALMGDKHPTALGLPLHEVWPTGRETIGPLLGRAWAGETITQEGTQHSDGRPGTPDYARFDLTMSPVRGADGRVAGTLVTVVDTARRVAAEPRRDPIGPETDGGRQPLLLKLSDALRSFADPADIQAAISRVLAEELGAMRAAERTRAETAEQASEERLRILVAELQHRVRNILTVVRSVFSRTVEVGGDPEEIADHFKGRLDALARTHAIVTRSAARTADLESLIRDELLSVGATDGETVRIEGPDVTLGFWHAESLGLAFHELTTNALKYGALKVEGATLDITWRVNLDQRGNRVLDIAWIERGVPAVSVQPQRHGFGKELIEEALPYRLKATTKLELRGGGIRCTISVPVTAEGEDAS